MWERDTMPSDIFFWGSADHIHVSASFIEAKKYRNIMVVSKCFTFFYDNPTIGPLKPVFWGSSRLFLHLLTACLTMYFFKLANSAPVINRTKWFEVEASKSVSELVSCGSLKFSFGRRGAGWSITFFFIGRLSFRRVYGQTQPIFPLLLV